MAVLALDFIKSRTEATYEKLYILFKYLNIFTPTKNTIGKEFPYLTRFNSHDYSSVRLQEYSTTPCSFMSLNL